MNARCAPWLVVAAALAAGAARAEATADDASIHRYAIVVGYNGPDDGTRPVLSYADDDAARVYLALQGGAARAWLLTTFDANSARAYGDLVDQAAQPTALELARVLGEANWLLRNAARDGKKTELFFYFAGHGDVSTGGEGFVVLADGAFTRGDLDRQVVQASPASVNHVVVDACSSYFMVESRGAGETSGAVPLSPELLDVLAGKAGKSRAAWDRTGTLVSTSGAVEVHESAQIGGGIFSFLLRSALAGAADANGDGRVEYGETAAYMAAASASLQDPRARLQVHAKAPAQAPHAALLDLRTSGADRFLVVDGQKPQRIRVLDARGMPYAELHREGGPPILVALVGNPYFVVQKGDEEAVLVPRHAGAYSLSSLSFDERTLTRGDDPDGQGRFRGLFASAYGPSFLSGFTATTGLLPPRDGPPLVVEWAQSGAPAFRVPWWPMAAGSFVVAGALAVGAGACAVGNVVAYAALERSFRETGTLDPALALETDAWRTASVGLGASALAAVVAGGGFALFGLREEGE